MTAARQRPTFPSFWLRTTLATRPATRLLIGLVLVAGVAAGLSLAGSVAAATTERVVVDRNSGLAISGFDPVAYFTDAQALLGKGEYEQEFAGAVWRFRNAGNRAAFIADPNVYMPRFGGYDPVDVARGVAVAGNPLLWIIRGERLYLFYAAETRDEFVDDSGRIIATADSAWPSVSGMLVP
jgi:hypothetical protein